LSFISTADGSLTTILIEAGHHPPPIVQVGSNNVMYANQSGDRCVTDGAPSITQQRGDLSQLSSK